MVIELKFNIKNSLGRKSDYKITDSIYSSVRSIDAEMTVKKAIMCLDILIENKQESKVGMLSPEKPLNHKEDCVTSLARAIARNLQNDVEWLQAIKRQPLPEQHRTK